MCSNSFPSRFYIRKSNPFLKNTFPYDLENLKGQVQSMKVLTYSANSMEKEAETTILLSSFQNFFDNEGQLTQVLSLNQYDETIWRYEFNMINDQNLLVCHCFNENDEIEEIIESIFDYQKKILLKSCYDCGGTLLWEIKYYYDNAGELLKTEPSPNNFFDCNIKSYYNDHFDEIERIETSPSGSKNIKTFDYLYDEHGNWVAQFERCEILNTTIGIKKRIIKYYD